MRQPGTLRPKGQPGCQSVVGSPHRRWCLDALLGDTQAASRVNPRIGRTPGLLGAPACLDDVPIAADEAFELCGRAGGTRSREAALHMQLGDSAYHRARPDSGEKRVLDHARLLRSRPGAHPARSLIGQPVAVSTAAGRGPRSVALCPGPRKDQPVQRSAGALVLSPSRKRHGRRPGTPGLRGQHSPAVGAQPARLLSDAWSQDPGKGPEELAGGHAFSGQSTA